MTPFTTWRSTTAPPPTCASSPPCAERRARVSLLIQLYQQCIISYMWLDLRQGLRRLRRSPLYTLAAILTLGLGMAWATAAFAVIDAVLVKPLPLRDPHRLVWI